MSKVKFTRVGLVEDSPEDLGRSRGCRSAPSRERCPCGLAGGRTMVRIAPALAALLLPLGAEAACPADDLGCAVEELREDMASIRSQLAGVQSLTLKLEERLARLERGYGELREEVRAR